MARETKAKAVPKAPRNSNLGTFVDAVTPDPKIITENFINFEKLAEIMKKSSAQQTELLDQMIEIALSATKQEEFLSFGERIAINSLRKQGILG
jgi:hypothetical protein